MSSNETSVATWIAHASRQLTTAHIDTARLDAEMLLSHTLHQPRTWLHAHRDAALTPSQIIVADARLQLRTEHVPVAYIIGHKEFYGRLFRVTPATLVPRPESETIIELLNQLITPHRKTTLIDVGTGSGCLGITAKLEHPNLEVTLSDINEPALKTARHNAKELKADVTCVQSDLLIDIAGRFGVIIANLPYVDPSWEVSRSISHEPTLALFAEDGGLALIKKLLMQATTHLPAGGYLLLEADPCQHDDIVTFAKEYGYQHELIQEYVVVLSRE